MKVSDLEIELAANALVTAAIEENKMRVAVLVTDDDVRREGRLLYADPKAMR